MEWVVYRVSCDCIHDTDKLIGEGLPVAGKYRLLESYRVVMSGANQNSVSLVLTRWYQLY